MGDIIHLRPKFMEYMDNAKAELVSLLEDKIEELNKLVDEQIRYFQEMKESINKEGFYCKIPPMRSGRLFKLQTEIKFIQEHLRLVSRFRQF